MEGVNGDGGMDNDEGWSTVDRKTSRKKSRNNNVVIPQGEKTGWTEVVSKGAGKTEKRKKSAAARKAHLNNKGAEKERTGNTLDAFTDSPTSVSPTPVATPPVEATPPPPEKQNANNNKPQAVAAPPVAKPEAPAPAPPTPEPAAPQVEEVPAVVAPPQPAPAPVEAPAPQVVATPPPEKEATPVVEEEKKSVSPPPPQVQPEPEVAPPTMNGQISNEIPTDKTEDSLKTETGDIVIENAPEAVMPPPTQNHVENHVQNDKTEPMGNHVSNDLSNGPPQGDEENIDPEEEGENGEKHPKLKYDYKEDQWSPLNLEGKKQYDREFLIQLQRDPLSMQKPCNLPNMEIIKDKANMIKKGPETPQSGKFDFMPGWSQGSSERGFVRPTNSRPGPPGGKRNSSQNKGRPGGGGGNPPRVIKLESMSATVELKKAENAWKPGVKAKDQTDLDSEELLKKKVRSILNKLTPQKFETLVNQFQELAIDSEAKLGNCMELVFEKAVDEPAFSVAYAQMCKVMQMKKVPIEGQEEQFVNFRKLLISRCQREFEKDYMGDLDRDQYIKDMNDAKTEEDKKRVKAEFEFNERRLRRRSLGNIRFIGELYKLQMLTARIMHECVKKLLKEVDDESLECLCRLLTTVGQELDQETRSRLQKGSAQQNAGINDLDKYFKEMEVVMKDKKTSARVRFLMQDVVELRLNNWKKRREDAGPKTIEQIHKDAEREKLEKSFTSNMPMNMGPPHSRDRGRDDNRKKSQRQGGGGGPQQGSDQDGWTNVPQRAARVNERIDTNKIKNIGKVDADSIQLGPSGGGMRPGGFSSWGRGSASAKTSRQENDAQMQNRFAAFSNSGEPSPGPQTDSYGGRRSNNFDNRNNRPSYMGRNSRGPSMDDERQKAIEAVKGFERPAPHSGPPPRSITPSQKETPRSVAPAPSADLLRGAPNLSYDSVEKLAKPLLDEFLHNCDLNEACICIKEKFHSSTISLFVELVFTLVLERSEKARTQVGQLLKELVKKDMLTPSLYQTGLDGILKMAEDLLVDIPKLWDFIADILAPAFLEKVLPLSLLRDSAVDLKENKLAGKYAAAVLHCMGKTGHVRVAEMWRENGLQWSSFLTKEQNVDEFVRSNKLEFTQSDSSAAPTKNSEMPQAQVESKIAEILANNKNSNEQLFDWIDTTMGDRAKSLPFIRTLVTCVAESSIDGIGGPGSQCKLNEDSLKLRNPVLKKYLDADLKREVEAIFALQHLMLKLEHPNKLLHSIFDKLYDEEVVSENGFFAWEANDDPAEQEGKGVALKSCTQFFTWLKEAEEEEEDTYCDPDRTVNPNAY